MTTVFSPPARAKAVQVDTVTPDEKAMLFYPTNPPVRNQLVANGILTTLQPKDETADLPASAVAIAERITAAYRAATDEAADHPDWQPEQVWKNIIDVAYAQLTGDLEHGDPERVAGTLENCFVSPVTRGLSMYGELNYLAEPGKRGFYADWWLDGLLCMSVFLGLLPERMSTGDTRPGDVATVEYLWAAVSDRLGITLDFPRVCNAWGLQFHGHYLPRTSWRHLHAAYVLRQEIERLEGLPRIVEVGGGFGAVAYWLNQLQPRTHYTLYDFPVVNAIAGYFLLRALPDVTVTLHGEPDDPRAPGIRVAPTWRITDEPYEGVDVTFNQDSLSEMPPHTAARYLTVFDRITRHVFFSENEESAVTWGDGVFEADTSWGEAAVPAATFAFKRLRQRRRFRAWMQRGYFEAYYRPWLR